MKGGYWKYSPRVVNISPREAKPREVIYDHKRWIFPISTFQMVDIHIIHNFIPPCSLLKWKSMFSKSANISLHKSNIRHLKKKVRIFHYINPISVIWNDRYFHFINPIFVIWNDGYWIYVGKYSHFFCNMGKYPLFAYLIKLWIMTNDSWVLTRMKSDSRHQ